MKKKAKRKAKKPAPVYLRLFEVAKRLGVHRQSVWRDIQNNYLKAVKFGGLPMVEEGEFKKYAAYIRQRKPRGGKKRSMRNEYRQTNRGRFAAPARRGERAARRRNRA